MMILIFIAIVIAVTGMLWSTIIYLIMEQVNEWLPLANTAGSKSEHVYISY